MTYADKESRYPAVFFDRDGILVRAKKVDGLPTSARTLEDIELIPSLIRLCALLNLAHIPTFMITNQPDIARGKIDIDVINEQNRVVSSILGLTDIAICPHDDSDGCDCRKPKPGLIHGLAKKYKIDLKQSLVVGDRWRDIDAGIAVGAMTLFVDYDYAEPKPAFPTKTITSIDEIVNAVLGLLHSFTNLPEREPQ